MPILRDDAPLIVTALLDGDSIAMLDGLRRRNFPAALNQVPAHVSLFHQLPGLAIDAVLRDIGAVCRRRASFDMEPDGLRFLGRGVAIDYASSELDAVRAALARAWASCLTAQDRQPFKAHVTIQNKVAPEAARMLLSAMGQGPLPTCRVEGVALWRYLGGPWEAVSECRFIG